MLTFNTPRQIDAFIEAELDRILWGRGEAQEMHLAEPPHLEPRMAMFVAPDELTPIADLPNMEAADEDATTKVQRRLRLVQGGV